MTTVLMTTNKGNIKVELDADKAPKTVANFLDYVNKG
ncbi:MAG: peptidylprolyl isomerase, partial [Massilia sp.]